MDHPWARVEIVSFDVGGTLVQPYPSIGEIYAEAMARFGFPQTAERVEAAFERAWDRAQQESPHADAGDWEKQWWRRLVLDVVQQLGGSVLTLDFERLFEELWKRFAQPRSWRFYDGALRVLQELRARGYRLGVLSNWDHRLRRLLGGLGLAPLFEHLVISAEVGVEKPDPRIFRHAERCFGLPSASFLHVGDSQHHDGAGARAAGWAWVQIRHGDPRPPRRGRISALDDLLLLLPENGPASAPDPAREEP